jgi:hypothetical protein
MEKKQVRDWKTGESARKQLMRLICDNPNALDLFERMEKDEVIQATLEQVNTVAITRLGYNDHGLTHSRVTSLNALKILEILHRRGVNPNIIAEHAGDYKDAQFIVLAGTYLHDLGNSVHRHSHYMFSIVLANSWLADNLPRYYSIKKATKIRAAVLECMYTHDESVNCISIESGCTKVGDGTDMAKGRARIPFSLGKMDIHAVSALAIDHVEIKEGTKKPVQIEVQMSCSAGLFQIQEVLGLKINTSGIKDYVEVVGTLTGEPREQVTKVVF